MVWFGVLKTLSTCKIKEENCGRDWVHCYSQKAATLKKDMRNYQVSSIVIFLMRNAMEI